MVLLNVACLIVIASTNPVKVDAVKSVFPNAEVVAKKVNSGVGDQPMGLENIIKGAKVRAENAYGNCNFSVGIESGIMELPGDDGHIDICCCSFFDGERHHTGFSCAFRVPPKAVVYIEENGVDLQQAIHATGITMNPALGAAEGLIGLLTNGEITRTDYTRQAVVNALVSLNYPELYSNSAE